MKPRGLLPGFTLPARKKTSSRTAVVRGLLPRRGFEATLSRYLFLLSGSHLKVTLFAIDSVMPTLTELEAAIADALSPLGSVGRLPDGRIGLLYLGPGGDPGNGTDGSRPLHDYVRDRIERRLADRGWTHQGEAVRLTAVGGWSDSIREAGDLIAALPARAIPDPRC